MDYLDMERERGITITAAAITMSWRKHTINLIDTPVPGFARSGFLKDCVIPRLGAEGLVHANVRSDRL